MTARFAPWLRPWLLAVFTALGAPDGRAAPAASEVQLKAAFIFHFTQFVDWPPQSFERNDAPFVIGVFGDDQMEAALTEMVRGEGIGHHGIEVRHLRHAADAANCQILYVSSADESLFRRARLHSEPVLTVGETDDFLQSGGMIEFFTDQNHVRLRINLPATRAASLQVSAKLIRVAEVYSPR